MVNNGATGVNILYCTLLSKSSNMIIMLAMRGGGGGAPMVADFYVAV